MKIVSVTLRFPAKKTQYGYAEAVVEFDGDWARLGTEYREAVQAFQAGENSDKVKPKAPEPEAPVYDTPPTPEEAERLITEQLGATNIDDIMNEDTEEETPEWEKPPPPPSDDDWDF